MYFVLRFNYHHYFTRSLRKCIFIVIIYKMWIQNISCRGTKTGCQWHYHKVWSCEWIAFRTFSQWSPLLATSLAARCTGAGNESGEKTAHDESAFCLVFRQHQLPSYTMPGSYLKRAPVCIRNPLHYTEAFLTYFVYYLRILILTTIEIHFNQITLYMLIIYTYKKSVETRFCTLKLFSKKLSGC